MALGLNTTPSSRTGQDKPTVVGGLQAHRGIIAAASYSDLGYLRHRIYSTCHDDVIESRNRNVDVK
jgi:hypothetical protein